MTCPCFMQKTLSICLPLGDCDLFTSHVILSHSLILMHPIFLELRASIKDTLAAATSVSKSHQNVKWERSRIPSNRTTNSSNRQSMIRKYRMNSNQNISNIESIFLTPNQISVNPYSCGWQFLPSYTKLTKPNSLISQITLATKSQ